MKKIFTLAVACLIAVAAMAQVEFRKNSNMKKLMDNSANAASVAAETEDLWGYYLGGTNNIFGLGTGSAGTFRVAIFVPGTGALKGAKIKAINLPILTAKSSSVSVWGGSTLGSKNSFEKSVSSVTVGYNRVNLDSEVEIPAAGLYVGYTFTVASALSEADQYPIGCNNGSYIQGGLYLATSATGAFQDYSSQFGVSALQIIVTGMNLPQNSLVIDDVHAEAAPKGGKGTFVVSLSSDSKNEIKNFGYTLTVNGVETNGTCNLASPIPSGLLQSGSATIEYTAPDTVGTFYASIAINTVNGAENEAGSDPAKFTVATVTRVVPRVTVVEEYTGTGCGWCPRGWVGMESVKEKRADKAIVIAWHNFNSSDAMYVASYADLKFSGAPGCYVDRKTYPDPYYGEGEEGILTCVDNYNQAVPVVDITVEAMYDTERKNVTVKSNTEFLTRVNGYTIAFVLTADSLRGTTTAWKQSNYYTQYSVADAGILPEMPELENFCKGQKWGQSSVALTFNDALISSSYEAGKNKIPAFTPEQQVPGNIVETQYTLAMPTKTTLLNALSYGKVYANVLVIDNNGFVANGKRVRVLDADGTDVINTIAEKTNAASTAVFNLQGMRVNNSAAACGIYIQNGRKMIIK